MFTHPTLTAQLAADHRLARRADATRRRARRASAELAQYAADVGERVADVGIDRSGADVAAVVAAARQRGVGTMLAAIAADASQPTVARERALGRLLAALANDLPTARSSQPAA
jgi:hypothetical protein